MAILIEGLDLPKNGKDLLSINIKPNGDVIRDMDIECEVIAHAIEPKRGQWIVADNKGVTRYYICSECGGAGDITMNHCPNCGARMEKSDD